MNSNDFEQITKSLTKQAEKKVALERMTALIEVLNLQPHEREILREQFGDYTRVTI